MHQSMVQMERGHSGCGREIDGEDVREMPELIREKAGELDGERRVVVLACPWRHCAGKDVKGLKALAELAEFRMLRVPCSGLVSADWVVRALDTGADAVLVLGGHPLECPYRLEAENGEGRLRSQIRREGYDPDRLTTDWNADPTFRLTAVVGRLIGSVEDLGPPYR